MKALLISNDSLVRAEIAAQGSARMPAMQLVASRNGLRDAVERQLSEAPDLVIVDAIANEGTTIKRFQPRAQGRAFPIHKPMTHITIVVADQEA